MLESREERGASFETGGAKARGDGQHRGESGHQESGGLPWSEAEAVGREEATQPRVNPTSQRGAEVQQVWGEGVTEHVQGRGGREGGASKNSDKGKELYTILYTNARSVLNKIDQLRTTVVDRKPSFVMICESFAKHDISDAYLAIDGYQLVVRQDGRDTMEGKCRGLLIYVKEGINAAKIENEEFERVTEMAGITVPGSSGESISLVLVYRPPATPGSEADMGNTERLCKVMRDMGGGF